MIFRAFLNLRNFTLIRAAYASCIRTAAYHRGTAREVDGNTIQNMVNEGLGGIFIALPGLHTMHTSMQVFLRGACLKAMCFVRYSIATFTNKHPIFEWTKPLGFRRISKSFRKRCYSDRGSYHRCKWMNPWRWLFYSLAFLTQMEYLSVDLSDNPIGDICSHFAYVLCVRVFFKQAFLWEIKKKICKTNAFACRRIACEIVRLAMSTTSDEQHSYSRLHHKGSFSFSWLTSFFFFWRFNRHQRANQG